MRKTEFLTDFLKSTYCDDEADRLSRRITAVSLIAAVVIGLIALINPFGGRFAQNYVSTESSFMWALNSFVAVLAVMSPFSLLLMINRPLARASKRLCENSAAILGYEAAEEFSEANTVAVDATALFPAGSVQITRVKHWQRKGAAVKTPVEEALIMAASIAIHTDGILAYPFYDMVMGSKDILMKVDNCIYEDNCGVTGWIGTKRVMLGGRRLLELHDIDLPSKKNEQKYCPDGCEPIYLAVSGEVAAMFAVSLMANPEITASLKALQSKQISLLVHSSDSLVSAESLADLFDIDASLVSVLPHQAHEEFVQNTKYTSRGSGALSCSGTFTSFTRAICAAKTLVHDFNASKIVLLGSLGLGLLLVLIFSLFRQTDFLTPSAIIIYNTLCTLVMAIVQSVRKY